MKVVYIGGLGRSGSTVLDRMLGEVPGFLSTGEIRDLWRRGLLENRLCGCGLPFRDCPFWTAVGQTAFGGWSRLDLEAVVNLASSVDRDRMVPAMVWPRLFPRAGRRIRRYAEMLARLYSAIHSVSGGPVIVDSSKTASTVYLLRRIPDVELRLVHLIRDSRGVAFSWTKHVVRPDVVGRTEYMHRFGPGRVGWRWMKRNLLMEALKRLRVPSVRVRYESLVQSPVEDMGRILEAVGEPWDEASLGFISDGAVRLRTSHTVMGNPVRMETGRLELRLDDEWKHSMKGPQRALVTLLTLPLLRAYRYPRS